MNLNKNTCVKQMEKLRKENKATPRDWVKIFCDDCEQKHRKDKSGCLNCYGASV